MKSGNQKIESWSLASLAVVALGFAGLFAGCSENAGVSKAQSDYDASKFVLDAEPEGGQNVIAVRETAKDFDDVVIVGRIGGGLNPWVEGRAAFQIVDPTLLACSDEKEDGEPCSCQTPWDYCCETDKLPSSMALVQFVESDGSMVRHDARAVFELKELQTVVVQGKAKRDDAGNLMVMASGMFIRE
jgi:hypothetical protein